jgi:hypothetical protein
MRDYEPYYTEDGSIGLYSYANKDVYHSKFGALTEAWEKFVIPAKIDKLLESGSFKKDQKQKEKPDHSFCSGNRFDSGRGCNKQ